MDALALENGKKKDLVLKHYEEERKSNIKEI